jgi:probable F420-dependent oxidoreductase
MHVDVMTTPRPLAQMGAIARSAQVHGFDGIVLTEGARTSFNAATAAAIGAPGLSIATGVAVAFARSPMVAAQVAWELQEATGGLFRLGLGTQVKTHIQRRYSAQFEQPGPRLRDYVQAVRASFAAFRGAPLHHQGPFYELTYIDPQWSPGPIEPPDPKVDVAAVNPWMLEMAGEVADGVHVHPIGEPGYLRNVVIPHVATGATRAGRSPTDIDLIIPVTTIVGDNDAEIATARDRARRTLSFYGSTPNYAFIWDQAGFEGTTARIRTHQKNGNMAAMADEITDDHLAVFCTEARWDDLADSLISTYADLAHRLVLYNPGFESPERYERYGMVAAEISVRTGGR